VAQQVEQASFQHVIYSIDNKVCWSWTAMCKIL